MGLCSFLNSLGLNCFISFSFTVITNIFHISGTTEKWWQQTKHITARCKKKNNKKLMNFLFDLHSQPNPKAISHILNETAASFPSKHCKPLLWSKHSKAGSEHHHSDSTPTAAWSIHHHSNPNTVHTMTRIQTPAALSVQSALADILSVHDPIRISTVWWVHQKPLHQDTISWVLVPLTKLLLANLFSIR